MSKTIPDYIDIELWNDFIQHRKEIRHKLTPTATKFMLRKLNKFYLTGIDVNACIERSIENGWQGIFEVQIQKELIPKNDDAAVQWGNDHGLPAKKGESMWNYRQRLQASL
jgi:hypothetical protein